METEREKEIEKEEERAEYGRRKLRGSALQRDIAVPQRPTLLAWRIARLPRRIPAPTVLLRAKWLIIIIIILYFLRSSETTEKQKAHEININKSSGHRGRTGERYPKMERANGVEKGGSRQRTKGEKEDTYIGKDGPREGKGWRKVERMPKFVSCIVARLGIYSWPG